MVTAELLPKWTPAAAAGLGETLGDDRDKIASQVDVGIAQLWRLNDGESWMVTRVEQTELVVCCYKGKNAVEVMGLLFAAAKRQRLTSIRFHTQRPALARMVAKFGFDECETVFRAKI